MGTNVRQGPYFQTMKNGPEGPLTWCLPALATRNQVTPSTLEERLAASARAYGRGASQDASWRLCDAW